MVRPSDFQLSGAKVVAFTPNASEFEPSAILASVLAKSARRFDGVPQVLPLPEGLPAEIDRITLKSKDEKWTFAASPARLNSVWNVSTVDRPHDVLQVVRDCSEIIENCVRENKLTVGRLGMILVRVVKHDEPGQVLIDRFCAKWARDPDSTDAPFRHSVDFQLHNHKRYSPKNLGFQINSWVRCKSGNLVADQSRILIFEQDLNSLAEELNDRRFSADDIRAYCETAVVEAQSILELYFGRDHDI